MFSNKKDDHDETIELSGWPNLVSHLLCHISCQIYILVGWFKLIEMDRWITEMEPDWLW